MACTWWILGLVLSVPVGRDRMKAPLPVTATGRRSCRWAARAAGLRPWTPGCRCRRSSACRWPARTSPGWTRPPPRRGTADNPPLHSRSSTSSDVKPSELYSPRSLWKLSKSPFSMSEYCSPSIYPLSCRRTLAILQRMIFVLFWILDFSKAFDFLIT